MFNHTYMYYVFIGIKNTKYYLRCMITGTKYNRTRQFEEEQGGKERAGYGEFLIKSLADSLEPQFGSGYSYRQLHLFRQFYRTFPIVNALHSQFSWTHYRTLIRIENGDKRAFYIAESDKNNWTARQLERQVNSQLFERFLLSNDVQSVLAVAREETELEIFDLLKKESLTKKEEEKVKNAAKTLLKRLKEEKPTVLINDWYKDNQTKFTVKDAIQKVLNNELPDTYEQPVFNAKCDTIFNHFYQKAVEGGAVA